MMTALQKVNTMPHNSSHNLIAQLPDYASRHIPVMLREVLEALNPQPGEFMIDGTYGAGGHARAIAARVEPAGKVLAIDWDKTGINFAEIPELLRRERLGKADGLLLDLGLSSEQLGSSGRGFSFLRDEPLLMTYHRGERPLYEMLKELSEEELCRIIRDYSDERYAARIARAIATRERRKPMMTTFELRDAILSAVPKNYERGRIHPATRTFLALRIRVNRELENLRLVLARLPEILRRGGRVAVLAFHSLEDKAVKDAFREGAKEDILKVITKKPLRPSAEEVARNPRARSARLRAALLR